MWTLNPIIPAVNPPIIDRKVRLHKNVNTYGFYLQEKNLEMIFYFIYYCILECPEAPHLPYDTPNKPYI